MKKLQIVSLCVAIVLLVLGASYHAMAMDYKDVQNHYAKEAVERWNAYGVIKGYQGAFRPNDKITRGELAVVLNRILGYRKQNQEIATFSDLENRFYTESMLALYEQGIMKGSNQKLRPNDAVTREEAAVLLVRALGLAGDGSESVAAKDSNEIAQWAKEAISVLMKQQFMKGYQGKVFPKKPLTRAEIVTLLDNIIGEYITQSGEYKITPKTNPYQLVIVRAGDVKLVGEQPIHQLMISAGHEASGVYLKNTSIGSLKVLQQDKKKMLLLENTKVQNLVAAEEDVIVYSDPKSEIKAGMPSGKKSKNLVEGIKQLQDKGLDFIQLPQTDELKPSFPQNGQSITPPAQNEIVDSEDLTVALDGLESDGIIYFAAGNRVVLPNEVILLKKSNGESSHKKVEIVWKADDWNAVQEGKAGTYTLQVETRSEFIINDSKYPKVRFKVTVIIR